MNYVEPFDTEPSASSISNLGIQLGGDDSFGLLMRDLDKLSLEADLENEDGYPEFIAVDIHPALAEAYGIASVEIPIRDILTLVAERRPELAERALGLRDDWFSDDDGITVDEFVHSPMMTREQRAVMRFERRKLNAERAETEALGALQRQAHDRFGLDGTFSGDRQALEAEREALDKDFHLLQAEWNQFVADRATWSGDFRAKEARYRCKIRSMEDKYGSRREDWERRLLLLGEQTLPHRENGASLDKLLADLDGL